jgi:hypothetical protein
LHGKPGTGLYTGFAICALFPVDANTKNTDFFQKPGIETEGADKMTVGSIEKEA